MRDITLEVFDWLISRFDDAQGFEKAQTDLGWASSSNNVHQSKNNKRPNKSTTDYGAGNGGMTSIDTLSFVPRTQTPDPIQVNQKASPFGLISDFNHALRRCLQAVIHSQREIGHVE